MREYQTKTGKTQFMQSYATLNEAAMSDGCIGFCLACGEEADGVEPDARRYECECCGEEKVYGAEELLMMGIAY